MRLLHGQVSNMKKLLPLLGILTLSLFAVPSANAGWSCGEPYPTTNPDECSAAGSQQTPEAFAQAFIKAMEKKQPTRAPFTVEKCEKSGNDYSCQYSFMIGSSKLTNTVSAKNDNPVQCPETLESRGANSSVTKNGDKYFVVWTVRQATNICHNSCSYMGESAAISNCYLVRGSTDTGFCNYFVGLNSADPSCNAEYGYTAPEKGDALSSGSGTGGSGTGSDGDGDGSGDNSGTGGHGGNGGNGGSSGESGGSDFDGELDFDSPGELDTDAIFEREQNALDHESYVIGLETTWNDSELGQAFNRLKETLLTTTSNAACPIYSTQTYLGTFVIDAHCELYSHSDVAGILATVFMCVWSLFAIRIVLSA